MGDAAGRAKSWDGKTSTKKDFSCGDRKFAHNLGVNFATPEEFFLQQDPAEFSWGFDPASINVARSFDTVRPKRTEREGRQEGKEREEERGEDSKAESKSVPIMQANQGSEVVIFVGLPASGKSTFAQKYFIPAGYVHVNQFSLLVSFACTQYNVCLLDKYRDKLRTKEKCLKACETVNKNLHFEKIKNYMLICSYAHRL